MKPGDRVRVRADAPERARGWLGDAVYVLVHEIRPGHWMARHEVEDLSTDVHEDEVDRLTDDPNVTTLSGSEVDHGW